MTEKTEQTDRDLLMELSTDVKWIKNLLTDHMAHHKRLFFAGIGVVTTLLISMGFYILTQ